MTEEEPKKARKAVEEKMRTVDMQVDTVSIEKAAGLLAYYQQGFEGLGIKLGNTITVNYVQGNEKRNDFAESESILIHEQKHRDNYLQGMYAYPMSMEQFYKCNMHDEISANICSLVALRKKYLETGDISVFDENNNFAFYKEALKNGEINPNSSYKEDFDKEMRLIVSGTQKMWMRDYAEAYTEQNGIVALKYYDYSDKSAAYWDTNYQRSLKIAYNIGGVDFTKYIDKDVEIPLEFEEIKKEYQNVYKELREAFQDERKENIKNKPEYLGSQQTNPIFAHAPQYRKWENKDGHRVSPVQYWQIPDLTKPIIKQPAQSYNKDKTTVKTQMKQDAKKANDAIKQIGQFPKISRADYNPTRALKTLYHKGFER